MSLYDNDRKEIQEMIDKAIESTPEYIKEETKQVKIVVLGIFLIFLMFFGTICFTSYQKTIRQKNELQIQAYGEIVGE